jgi:hypothetical protein
METVEHLNHEMACKFIKKHGNSQLIDNMQTIISTYGKDYTVKSQAYEDICERETETVE